MNSVANSISVVDLDTLSTIGEPLALIGGDARYMPFGRYLGMWLSPKGDRLFVYNAKRGTIDRFDTDTLQQTGADKVRYRFMTLAASPARHRVAIADKQGVSIADGRDLAMEKRLSYCGYGNYSYPTMALSAGGRYLAFHARRSPDTWIVDTQSGETVRRYPVDGYVMGLAFSPDGATLYQLNGDDSVSFYDTSTTLDIGEEAGASGPRFCTPFQKISVDEEQQARSF